MAREFVQLFMLVRKKFKFQVLNIQRFNIIIINVRSAKNGIIMSEQNRFDKTILFDQYQPGNYLQP